jgi:hypothetical protein
LPGGQAISDRAASIFTMVIELAFADSVFMTRAPCWALLRPASVQIALDHLDLGQRESWVQFAAPDPINECGLDNETDVSGKKEFDCLEKPVECQLPQKLFRSKCRYRRGSRRAKLRAPQGA